MSARDEAADRVQAFARMLAPALSGWTHEPPAEGAWCAVFAHPDGARVGVTIRDGRASWSPCYPRDATGYMHIPRERLSITTAVDRPAAQIARDVTVRLLTPYLVQYVGIAAQIAGANDYEAATVATLARLAKIAGDERAVDRRARNGGRATVFFHLGDVHGDATVQGDCVNLELRGISVDLAAEILGRLAA